MALASVVIPCYSRARFPGEDLESVMEQAYAHFEVMVVDDGPTDNTPEVASRYPEVRCIGRENRGLAKVRNEGAIVYEPPPENGPGQRCPGITRAREALRREPRGGVREGLERTLPWFAVWQVEGREASTGR